MKDRPYLDILLKTVIARRTRKIVLSERHRWWWGEAEGMGVREASHMGGDLAIHTVRGNRSQCAIVHRIDRRLCPCWCWFNAWMNCYLLIDDRMPEPQNWRLPDMFGSVWPYPGLVEDLHRSCSSSPPSSRPSHSVQAVALLSLLRARLPIHAPVMRYTLGRTSMWPVSACLRKVPAAHSLSLPFFAARTRSPWRPTTLARRDRWMPV